MLKTMGAECTQHPLGGKTHKGSWESKLPEAKNTLPFKIFKPSEAHVIESCSTEPGIPGIGPICTEEEKDRPRQQRGLIFY
ncbi:hypothetical protein Y1Q_0017254 [Alligator mississippiensis]|uniref:Uncharacterized protein n=1 Tax=Alligator mississippiensis TaxID=8496 RepID=A0A151NKX9_ALLMI|nr:hypothetical protein Y1Q_0017254 [Alligator mississippiensis]